MAEEKMLYWLLCPSDTTYSYARYYAFKTAHNITFEELLEKASTSSDGKYIRALTYSKDGYEGVAINNNESLGIAIDYKGEDAYDIKKGIKFTIDN